MVNHFQIADQQVQEEEEEGEHEQPEPVQEQDLVEDDEGEEQVSEEEGEEEAKEELEQEDKNEEKVEEDWDEEHELESGVFSANMKGEEKEDDIYNFESEEEKKNDISSYQPTMAENIDGTAAKGTQIRESKYTELGKGSWKWTNQEIYALGKMLVETGCQVDNFDRATLDGLRDKVSGHQQFSLQF